MSCFHGPWIIPGRSNAVPLWPPCTLWLKSGVDLRETLHSAVERLAKTRVPSPRMNAELLLMFTLDCDRAYLYAHPERELTPDEERRYDEAIARRATGVPAQYITGHQEFWGLDLIVSSAVLIPRPETEHAVETVLELLWDGHSCPSPLTSADLNKSQQLALPPTPRVVDVGTATGAIALALAKELPSAEMEVGG